MVFWNFLIQTQLNVQGQNQQIHKNYFALISKMGEIDRERIKDLEYLNNSLNISLQLSFGQKFKI